MVDPDLYDETYDDMAVNQIRAGGMTKEVYGPELCPVVVFKLYGVIERIVRCINVDGELLPVGQDLTVSKV